MNRKKNITEQVAKAMNSLDGIQPAAANPHLYTRIKARMEQEKSNWSWLASFLSRPVVAVALVATVILINLLTITSNRPDLDESNDQLVSLAQDYSFQPSNILENGFNQP
jgi:hypothetical protein